MIAKRAALEQAARTGAFNVMDPMERYRYLEALGVPELMEDFKMDLMEVERENDELAQGMPVAPPMPWQNQPLHIARHRRFVISDKYRALPPPLQGAVLEHMMLHQQMMAQSQMQQGAGQNAPNMQAGPAGGSKGTAQGDQAGTEKEMRDEEAQNASPA